jgi:hypothetical protein
MLVVCTLEEEGWALQKEQSFKLQRTVHTDKGRDKCTAGEMSIGRPVDESGALKTDGNWS